MKPLTLEGACDYDMQQSKPRVSAPDKHIHV